ncbi:MAG TPA: hypothetical protein VIS96_00470 [Terrimicrobiaceae bacterium]
MKSSNSRSFPRRSILLFLVPAAILIFYAVSVAFIQPAQRKDAQARFAQAQAREEKVLKMWKEEMADPALPKKSAAEYRVFFKDEAL